jgi:hypothetical protein
MKTKKRIINLGITVIVFCAVFIVASSVKAGVVGDIAGWLWGGSDDGAGNSSGVGWISMSNTNTAGAIVYGVNVPATDGDLSGSAWSENLGYITFDKASVTGCPDGNCMAKRVGNNIQGWARFSEIAKAAAVGNSGGWLGWIKLNGAGYGVTIDASGKLNGNAWSDELGWINFSRTTVPAPPTVTLTPNVVMINLEDAPKTTTLTWSSTGATNCDVISTPTSNWVAPNIGLAGTKDINVPKGMNETFTIKCQGPGGEKSATALISVICYPKECNGSTQTCNNKTTPLYGQLNPSECNKQSQCSSDSNCKHRSVDKWTEVTPN